MNSKKENYIICSHLLNNYSGSPFVLSQVVTVLDKHNYRVKLYIGNKAGVGFLSNLPIEYNFSFYKFFNNKLLRLLFLFGVQFSIFIKIAFTTNKSNCQLIYANTLYSFGAALAGKLMGIKVIYHIHETSLKPKILKQFLVSVAKKTSSLNVFVSRHHMQTEQIHGIPSRVIYNSLNPVLFEKGMQHNYILEKSFNVLMVCSLKEYKGVNEYIQIAQKLEANKNITFKLIVNDNKLAMAAYFKNKTLPTNLILYEAQSNLQPFYGDANLVLNLSHPETWVETFGLTLLEAMCFGIPVIAPPVGGPTELVAEGENGYLISCYEIETIAQKITELSKNSELLMYLSKNAKIKAAEFSPAKFESQLLELIHE